MHDGIRVLRLDVTHPASIAPASDEDGEIDVRVNSAGIGMVGAFETAPMDHLRRVFETNTFGTMALIRAVIAQMREACSGLIVNITSSATIAPMPLVAACTASKQAIQGFSGSIVHELGAFGVRVKLIEPGHAPTTQFAANMALTMEDMVPAPYAEFSGPIFAHFANPPQVRRESDVAAAVWAAGNDASDRLRWPARPDTIALAAG